MKLELLRKVFHIVSILLLLIPLELFGKFSITILMLLMLCIFFPISYFRIKNTLTYPFWKLLEYVERKQNWETIPGKQAYSLAVGLSLVSLIFPEKAVKVAIISTAIYDGIATIVGKLIGKHKILFTNKSIEGTVTGIVANTLALLLILPLWKAIFISVVVALVELIAKSEKWYLDDNLLIPIVSAVAYFLFS